MQSIAIIFTYARKNVFNVNRVTFCCLVVDVVVVGVVVDVGCCQAIKVLLLGVFGKKAVKCMVIHLIH
jgi:hypothetical protein